MIASSNGLKSPARYILVDPGTNHWFIPFAMQKKRVTINLEGKRGVFRLPEIQVFFSSLRIRKLNGQNHLSEDGKTLLEAIFDDNFFKVSSIVCPRG